MSQSPEPSAKPFNPDQFELENFLPYQLSLLTNTISQGIAKSYRNDHDISIPEWRVLAVLGRFPGLSSSELAERTGMDKVAISRAVKRLEERNLLLRKAHTDDRRRQCLTITKGAGQAVLSEVIPNARGYESALLSAISEDELALLVKTLEALQHAASNLNAHQDDQ